MSNPKLTQDLRAFPGRRREETKSHDQRSGPQRDPGNVVSGGVKIRVHYGFADRFPAVYRGYLD